MCNDDYEIVRELLNGMETSTVANIAELYHSIAQSRYQLKDYNSARQDRNNRDDSKSSDICKAFASIHEYQDDFGSATSNYIRAIEIGEE
ncbi:unnamed protein product [Rotaria magnacalcarata]|uniref:Uncharacterized protein n=1 Tax=Rotaria magnacalcarata TaxID=392030 RepID=A0A8S3ERP2_9BILA|nr:unnamed protein product [Rotaria magnacalcarata]